MYATVGIGGVFGAVLRYLISGSIASMGHIPLAGTLFINVSGCFMLGFLQGWARLYQLPNWFVIGLGTGFIGAFTTFSTFSMEVVMYMVHGQLLIPMVYFISSSVGGYLFVYFGFSLANRKGA